MNPEERDSLNAAVWRNTTREPGWLGYWLARHLQTEDLEEPQLAAKLGMTMDQLVLLCLCRTPRDGNLFQEDLRAVCGQTGASETVLAQLLRQEQNRLRWAQAKPSAGGWLTAASDAPPPEPGDDQ